MLTATYAEARSLTLPHLAVLWPSPRSPSPLDTLLAPSIPSFILFCPFIFWVYSPDHNASAWPFGPASYRYPRYKHLRPAYWQLHYILTACARRLSRADKKPSPLPVITSLRSGEGRPWLRLSLHFGLAGRFDVRWAVAGITAFAFVHDLRPFPRPSTFELRQSTLSALPLHTPCQALSGFILIRFRIYSFLVRHPGTHSSTCWVMKVLSTLQPLDKHKWNQSSGQ